MITCATDVPTFPWTTAPESVTVSPMTNTPTTHAPEDPLQKVQLTRALHLWQRRKGHRSATDDILCAYYGLKAVPSAANALDIGAGQGSVCLMLSGVLPTTTRFTAVEAQEVSHGLLVRNIADNRLTDRFAPMHADLRSVDLAARAPFDLITGSPPYMPLGSGPLPQDPQRAAARFELRGGVEAYAAAIARWLGTAPHCRGVLLMDGAQSDRNAAAFAHAGLHVAHTVTVLPRTGAGPRYLVYAVCKTVPSTTGASELTIRDVDGQWTPEFEAIREALNLPRSGPR